jgi:hypothetical protein
VYQCIINHAHRELPSLNTSERMTIPQNNWCPTCEEGVHDHATICTICGDALGPPPSTSTARQGRGGSNPSSSFGVRAVPEFMTDDFRLAGREVGTLLSNLRGQVQDINAIARQAMEEGNGEWEDVPAELLAPQNADHRGRPTAKETLAKIPRIVLDDKSSLFRQASLELSSLKDDSSSIPLRFPAIPAEFGPTQGFQIEKATLIEATPRTAKGGLSEETKAQISQSSNPIVYLERGDGVTFVNKAVQAQKSGAVAAIIGNNTSAPWPYVMKDSSGEAEKSGLDIPVVMIKQADGKALIEHSKRNNHPPDLVLAGLRIQSLMKDCVVCCDTFANGETVMQLPSCGHVFHKPCALAWLTKHNTCPFCRRELPTDDSEYEQERRRTQRTHAGSASGNNESQWSEFYG